MRIWCAAVAVTWLCAPLSAQPSQPAKKLDLLSYIQAGYAGIKADLTGAAEAMPEGDYGFKPSGLLAHDAEMYGITTVYLRAKNIVPPSTARQKTGR